jgi:hypothetical protein
MSTDVPDRANDSRRKASLPPPTFEVGESYRPNHEMVRNLRDQGGVSMTNDERWPFIQQGSRTPADVDRSVGELENTKARSESMGGTFNAPISGDMIAKLGNRRLQDGSGVITDKHKES